MSLPKERWKKKGSSPRARPAQLQRYVLDCPVFHSTSIYWGVAAEGAQKKKGPCRVASRTLLKGGARKGGGIKKFFNFPTLYPAQFRVLTSFATPDVKIRNVELASSYRRYVQDCLRTPSINVMGVIREGLDGGYKVKFIKFRKFIYQINPSAGLTSCPVFFHSTSVYWGGRKKYEVGNWKAHHPFSFEILAAINNS